MTISPELFKQFNRLVDLAVVTNIMPYILSMAAVGIIMREAKVAPKQAKLYTFVGLIGGIYSFYALISTGYFEVFWGRATLKSSGDPLLRSSVGPSGDLWLRVL